MPAQPAWRSTISRSTVNSSCFVMYRVGIVVSPLVLPAAKEHVHVWWFAPFLSGGGYCSEAISLVQSLEPLVASVSITHHGDSYNDKCVLILVYICSCPGACQLTLYLYRFVSGLDAETAQTLRRMSDLRRISLLLEKVCPPAHVTEPPCFHLYPHSSLSTLIFVHTHLYPHSSLSDIRFIHTHLYLHSSLSALTFVCTHFVHRKWLPIWVRQRKRSWLLSVTASPEVRAGTRQHILFTFRLLTKVTAAWYPPNYQTSLCPPPEVLSTSAVDVFVVGRTMFETDRIPSGWEERW